MIDRLNLKASRWPLHDGREVVSPQELQEIRLAALLHDCGHGLFSHTSERVYENHHWIRDLKSNFPIFKGVAASEILSYLIVRTEAFARFWERVKDTFPSDKILNTCKLENVANLIIRQVPPEKLYLADIINGPFDADKLEYIKRDAYFTGLPLMVDIDRLLYSAEVGDVEDEKIWHSKRIIVSFGGIVALEQILLSKLHLYTNVYRHPKVRAVESWIESVLTEEMHKGTRMFQDPIAFLEQTDMDWLSYRHSSHNSANSFSYLMECVRRRLLPMRVLLLCKDTVVEEEQKDFGEMLKEFGRAKWPLTKKGLEDTLREEISYKMGLEIPFITVDFPPLPSHNEPSQTYVSIHGVYQPVLMEEQFKTMQWLGTFTENKWRGHIFCPGGFENKICKIVKSVVEEKLEIKLKPLAIQLAIKNIG
jgi:HD superfamily phosphohydrolase